MSIAALEVRGLTKSFGAAQALRALNFTVEPGEVHALLGQNGCGKSTLVKTLTGVHSPDKGTAAVYGNLMPMPVRAPHDHGIAVIHQDIGLVDSMTVLENLGANAGYGTHAFGIIRNRTEAEIYRELMGSLDFEVSLDAAVADLSPAERAMVAVVRAMRLMRGRTTGQLFILDEPTAALSRQESGRVLDLMKKVAALGSAVVFISHRLGEVMDSCDRVTVMRDGTDVMTADVADVDRGDIIQHMLGERMEEFFPAAPARSTTRGRLEVTGITGEQIRDLNLTVGEGEILGITGLAGMGQEELPLLLAGVSPSTGTISVEGKSLKLKRPQDAIDAGIVLVPGNRLRDGCWASASAQENVTLPILSKFWGVIGLRAKFEAAFAHRSLSDVGLDPLEPNRLMTSFSGGNQQKVVFAKWLQLDPKVLLLNEPTQGVDAGAAKNLLDQVVERAKAGTSVIVVSGDFEQLVEICHRVIVLGHGQVIAELLQADLTEEALVDASAR